MTARQDSQQSAWVSLLLASRPKFLTASVSPVLVGTCLGYAVTGEFDILLFVLASLAIMALHAGANMVNDYYDHLSQNDWINKNATPFSGGSRFIQRGILSPKAVFLGGIVALILGSLIGIVIVVVTQSLFITALGLSGLLGGFFYTARPVQLGYRSVGEFVILLLFGILPVFGAYYLQTGRIDATPVMPALVVGILIFLVILINEFPDLAADAAVSKKTLVVVLGVKTASWVYRAGLAATFLIAAAMLTGGNTFAAGIAYLLTIPIAALAVKFSNSADLARPGRFRASQITVLLHAVGSLALSAGLIISGLRHAAA